MMTPYELRERLKKDVPEVKIYPILTNAYYSEKEYQEVLEKQLKLKYDIEKENMVTLPLFSWKEKELKMDKFYEKGWYKPKLYTLPKSMFRSED
ncbi:TPA: hypothetical protein RHK09_001801 [Enterococcus faecalis]|uniref:Uncharacterized protein n=2 Tax=Enterococcus faecalis TaxID=1351 RepID=A0ABD7XAP1_ENTFL|nr:hypothetical protein [Enterococcus faecalis]EFQ67839.1 hypothetical protein HMPREF9493_01083 [Enterococcus faecalis DAPTO 516]ETC91499.1 hypothetical protein T481_12545 [Enterococcus faecalis PF3]HAP3745356.1 hypothetical protein [Enterococcus faecalis TDR28]HAP3751284.1 hypothetical protein [Enterococcus faecalis TDR22]HAP3754284.1 hypothetical protein [Enterococcus faecalis TDR13]HAP3757269.1 hypothetical protein [Enterococcus faecalis TDR7]HAP3768138.1 hypothetical protein [Enterococcu